MLITFSIIIRLPSDMRNKDIYDVFRYSHHHSITFRHEKRRHLWCLQVFSSSFNYLLTWEMRPCMMFSGILIIIRLPSDTRNEDVCDVFKYSHFDSILSIIRNFETCDNFRVFWDSPLEREIVEYMNITKWFEYILTKRNEVIQSMLLVFSLTIRISFQQW